MDFHEIAAGTVIWPLYIISNPLLLVMIVIIAGLLYWLLRRPKAAMPKRNQT